MDPEGNFGLIVPSELCFKNFRNFSKNRKFEFLGATGNIFVAGSFQQGYCKTNSY